MLKWVEKAWAENSDELKNKLERGSYYSYDGLLKLAIDFVLNPYLEENTLLDKLNADKITTIDDGEWQGTQIFIVPTVVYQPCESDYYWTSVWYGSCSACDALEAANGYKRETERVQAWSLLCLRMLQGLSRLTGDDSQDEDPYYTEPKIEGEDDE